TLSDQARLKGNTAEGARLSSEAGLKYAEAVRIKPDDHMVNFNQACLCALRGDSTGAIKHLTLWAKHCPSPSQSKLDGDADFHRIRNTREFCTFRESLPQ
ncbi:MAG: hypothetical protein RDV41_12305, partial [Planctomycetota bacterium]|nr:hypothetical protein [Planctomycetota bacterium]